MILEFSNTRLRRFLRVFPIRERDRARIINRA